MDFGYKIKTSRSDTGALFVQCSWVKLEQKEKKNANYLYQALLPDANIPVVACDNFVQIFCLVGFFHSRVVFIANNSTSL